MPPANIETTPRPGTLPAAVNDDSRERIIQGAIRSIARHGLERSSMASVAREAGVARQTVYAYYSNREDVLRDAITRSATELTDAAVAKAKEATTAADFLIELTLAVFYGVREHPAISAMLYSVETPEGREMTMSTPVLDIVVEALRPLVDYEPALEPRLGIIAETSLRMSVSLLTFPSERTQDPELLRAYLTDLLASLTK